MEGTVEDKVDIQLRSCFDPEIPVNIVDLGLVYAINVLPLGMNDFRVEIVMTLTAPACGMGPVLVGEVEEKIRLIKGVQEVKVDLVFDPPWDRDRMSDEAKLQLGLM
jgi:probable FeS assembly SUF system protein SufT